MKVCSTVEVIVVVAGAILRATAVARRAEDKRRNRSESASGTVPLVTN